jgi:hypothetical protein
MRFGEYSVKVVKGAAPVRRLCDNCNNVTDHVLVDQPYGIGFGLPFSKRPLRCMHRAYGLACPTCTSGVEISKDEAQSLIRKGQSQ